MPWLRAQSWCKTGRDAGGRAGRRGPGLELGRAMLKGMHAAAHEVRRQLGLVPGDCASLLCGLACLRGTGQATWTDGKGGTASRQLRQGPHERTDVGTWRCRRCPGHEPELDVAATTYAGTSRWLGRLCLVSAEATLKGDCQMQVQVIHHENKKSCFQAIVRCHLGKGMLEPQHDGGP